MKRTKSLLALVLAVSLALAAGCGNSSAPSSSAAPAPSGSGAASSDPSASGGAPEAPAGEAQDFSVGTSSVGGLMYVVGAGWANIMNNEFTGKYQLTAEVTGGNPSNMALLESGEVEFCTMGVMTAAEGYAGSASWTGGTKYKKLRAMLPLNPMTLTAVSLKGSGIETLSDLSGKVVGLGSKGSAVDSILQAVFAERGITPKSIHNDGWSATISALSDGTIDAVITMQMSPWPALVELQTTKETQFITFTAEDLAAVKKVSPSMADSVIPAGSYKGLTEDIPSVSDWATLSTSADVPDEVVYDLVKATFEHYEDMKLLHTACQNIIPENAVNVAIPFHPGAVKYYNEKGITLPEPTVKPEE